VAKKGDNIESRLLNVSPPKEEKPVGTRAGTAVFRAAFDEED